MLTSTDHLYEVLFRFSQDGTIAGAHRKNITVLEDSEKGVRTETESAAIPVEGADIEDLLGEIVVAQAATIADRDSQISVLQSQVSQLQQQLESLMPGHDEETE